MSLRIEDDLQFQLSKTHKKLWDRISTKLAEKGYIYTGTQCQNKWKSVKREYRSVIDHNAKSGNEPKTCKFFDEMNNLYGNKPSTRPQFVLDTSDPCASKSKKACKSTPIIRSNLSKKTSASTATATVTSESESPGASSGSASYSSNFPTEFSDSDIDVEPDKTKTKVPERDSDDDDEPKRKKKVPGRALRRKSDTQMDTMMEWMNNMEKARFEFIQKQNKEKLNRLDRLLDILSDKSAGKKVDDN